MRNVDHNFEEKISGLLSTLKRVEAPGDFDFKVRARIAQGRPAAARAFWLPASVKVAVPLGLVLSVGGYFGFNALYSVETSMGSAIAVAPVAEPQPTRFVPLKEDEHGVPPAPPSAEVAQVNAMQTREARKPVTAAVRKISTIRRAPESEGGSVDSAARESKSIFPVGVDPNANIPVPVLPGASTPGVVRISGKDVLDRIGVSAVFAAGTWRVQSVNASSSAGKAGLQTGDVIEAVNGTGLSEKAVIEPGFSTKSLRVRRDGRTVFIGLIQ
ncbi:MAG TPA: hypothetical protein VNA17_10260 [Pyrinomonadaceae bacterium]|nr:hypothetical protein [Pyrinomonadaceae bacterium]